jgi:hypothetical protein
MQGVGDQHLASRGQGQRDTDGEQREQAVDRGARESAQCQQGGVAMTDDPGLHAISFP